MFDIGFTELTLLAVVGLLVLGPERLPAVTRVVAGYLRKARRTWAGVRAEIEAELSADEIRRSVRKPIEELQELRKSAMQNIDADSGAAATPKAPEPEPPANKPTADPPPPAGSQSSDGQAQ